MIELIKKTRFFFLIFGLIYALCLLKAMASPDIALITAMQSEKLAIESKIKNTSTILKNGINYTFGNYKGKNLVLVATGVGKVNAAIITTALISSFHPKTIIFSGIAGAIQPNLQIGQLIVGTNLYEIEHLGEQILHDKDAINPNTNKANPYQLNSNKKLVALAKKVAQQGDYNPRVIFGRIATSDIFPSIPYIEEQARKSKSLAIEMEGFSVLATCQVFHTPCIVIRSISNNSKKNISNNDEQVAESSMSKFTLALVSKLN